MNNSVPEIPGYQFDQRLLQHALAELWHGRNFTGMEVVALVLSESGARDTAVRDRLVRASRDAALEPGRFETPLWAANLSAERPYAITQLIPGQTGAERLIDPLDGILGNDEESLQAVRAHLSQYGATPPATGTAPFSTAVPPNQTHSGSTATPPNLTLNGRTATPYDHTSPESPPNLTPSDNTPLPSYTEHAHHIGGPQPTRTTNQPAGQHPTQTGPHPEGSAYATEAAPQSKLAVAREYRRRIGAWVYLVAAVVVLLVFTVTYSVGAAVGSSVKHEDTNEAAPAPAISPAAYPSPVLLPAIERTTTAPYKRPDGSPGVFGATYPAGADLQVVENAELPFALGWPRPPQVDFLGESSSLVLRRVVTKSEYAPGGVKNSFKAGIALHPCVSLAQCLADRPAFDQQWTDIFKAQAPVTAKDSRTWLTVGTSPYTVTMTRAFLSGGQWWLVGTAVSSARPGEEPDVQRIVNDIWRQTS